MRSMGGASLSMLISAGTEGLMARGAEFAGDAGRVARQAPIDNVHPVANGIDHVEMVAGGNGSEIPFRIIENDSAAMYDQELEYSCGAACGRTMLRDEGVVLSEAEVRNALNRFSISKGVMADDLAQAMNKLAKQNNIDRRFDGGLLMHDGIDEHFDTFMGMANSGNPFMSNLNGHWVIVDRFDASRAMVRMRDPWNSRISSDNFASLEFGRTVEMDKSDFINAWQRTNGGAVW